MGSGAQHESIVGAGRSMLLEGAQAFDRVVPARLIAGEPGALLRMWARHYRQLRRTPGGQSSVNRLLSYLAAVSSDDLRRVTAAYQTIQRTTEKNDVTTIAEKLRREGRREERVDMLRMLLEERFGPLPEAILAKLAAASATDLRRWAKRVLKARTLAQTLA